MELLRYLVVLHFISMYFDLDIYNRGELVGKIKNNAFHNINFMSICLFLIL